MHSTTRLSLITALAFLLAVMPVVSKADSTLVLPQHQSEWLIKLNLTNRPSKQPVLINFPEKRSVERTASFLSILAVPTLLFGLLTRKEKALSTVLLSASIGFNVGAIYLRLRQRKHDNRPEINLLSNRVN